MCSALPQWESNVDPQHLRDIAQHIWGDDSQALMREFQPTPGLLMNYQHTILDCEHALRGRRVLDLGCNNGIYSYLASRHGAAHVLGVEPRGMFVKGLNAFAEQHQLDMEFKRGYDSDLARLVREHDTDTVMMLGMDELINWERSIRTLRDSGVEWIVLRMTSIPDAWVGFMDGITEMASKGAGMPVGFTLHYEGHNSDTRAGMNDNYRDQADPDTGYQHIGPAGGFQPEHSKVFYNRRSTQYIRRFIESVGMTVSHTKMQGSAMPESPALPASLGLYQWYLLQNQKQ